jgi:hypothetical protein
MSNFLEKTHIPNIVTSTPLGVSKRENKSRTPRAKGSSPSLAESVRRRVEAQKLSSALRLEMLTGGLAPETKFTLMNRIQKNAQLQNLTSALARYIAEERRAGFSLTLTFGPDERADFEKMAISRLIELAERQYKSLMAFLYKMRKSKRIKHKIRYMAVIELQSDGNLHLHIFLSVLVEDLFGFLEFVYDFKKRYTEPYPFNGSVVYPIGRLHIGISMRYRPMIDRRYTMNPVQAKSDSSRTEFYIVELESREFLSGNWTPVEFYTTNMWTERYEEKVTKYLVKTLTGEYELEEHHIKEGIGKCQLGHDTKTLLSDDYITQLQVRFVRLIGKRAYTHSRLPFPSKLYQRHYKALIAYNPDYTVYYNCITALEEGKLVIDGQRIFDENGHQIAPVIEQTTRKDSL